MVKELRLERLKIVKRGLKSSQEVTKETTRRHDQLKIILTVAVTYFDHSKSFLSHRFHHRIPLKSSLRSNWFKLVAQTCSNWIKPVPNQSSLNKSRIYISAFELTFLIKVHRQGYSSTLGRIVSRWEIIILAMIIILC